MSPGCDNCYMFAAYPRLKSLGSRGYETEPTDVRLMEERVERPLRWQRPRMAFVNSMSDMFHPEVPYEYIDRVFDVMARAEIHTFQVLTKRPGRAVDWWKQSGMGGLPDNVWLGVSVETQKYAPRIDVLARMPVKCLFVSAEPLLGEVDLSAYMDRVDWLIVGGESGVEARPMDLDWARSLRDQAVETATPFFLKQLGGRGNKRGGDAAMLDGRCWVEFPDSLSGGVVAGGVA